MGYHIPRGGLPPQTAMTTGGAGRARFTEEYAVIPARTQSDITASYLPGFDGMRMWVLARPLSGFAETFSWYLAEVSPGGGTDVPDLAESVLFVVDHGQTEPPISGRTAPRTLLTSDYRAAGP
jgi:(S)-ureidoglycine aminohydrolase